MSRQPRVRSPAGRGFPPLVENEYPISDPCGPHLFLVKRR